MSSNRPITALDLGNSQVTALVGELDAAGKLCLLGAGTSESKGFRRSVPVNLDAAVEAARMAIENAERSSGVELDTAVIGISGSHIRSFNSRGGTSLGVRSREVRPDDVHRALDAARGVRLPPEQHLLHVVPQSFLLDEEDGIREPLGLIGKRLEVNVHMVTAGQAVTQNLVSVANRTGMVVEDTVFSSLAASEACLTRDEKEMGTVLVDLGGGSTNWVVYSEQVPRQSGVVPVGGEHFTNDIAIGLRCPHWEAERLKREHGCAGLRWIGQDALFEISSLGGRPQRVSSKRALCDIVEPRARELASLLHQDFGRAGFDMLPPGGMVLTGGGAKLGGFAELLAHQFRVPVRIGVPQGIAGSNGSLSTPSAATAAGLLLHAARIHRARQEQGGNWFRKLKGILGAGGRAA